MFPNRLMVLRLYETSEAQTFFSSSGILLTGYGNVDVLVIEGNGTETLAFTLSGWAETSGIAILSGQIVSGNLTFLKANFTLDQSNIGYFNPTILIDLVNIFFNDGVVPAINSRLKKGFQLPTVKGLEFVNPTIGYGNRYIYVSTDINFTPPIPAEGTKKEGSSAIKIF